MNERRLPCGQSNPGTKPDDPVVGRGGGRSTLLLALVRSCGTLQITQMLTEKVEYS